MPHSQDAAALTPQPLQEMQFAMAATRVLTSAVQLHVFTHIAGGRRTVAAVAAAEQADPRGLRMLLDAAVGLGLLRKSGPEYALAPLSARYLVAGEPDYLGYAIETEHLWQSWSHLTEAVRNGRPYRAVNRQPVAESFFPGLVRSLHVQNRQPAERLALALRPRAGSRVLDVGCGSGVWSLALARADRSLRVCALDFAPVLELTREYAQAAQAAAQYEFRAGNLRSTELGCEQYDLALLANIVHSEDEATLDQLFSRIRQALRPGGRIVIVDMLPNDERSGPVFPLLFALNMLVNTEQGGVYTLQEYRTWLQAAGFTAIDTVEIGSHSPAIVAQRN